MNLASQNSRSETLVVANTGAAVDGLGSRIGSQASCIMTNGSATPTHPSGNRASVLVVPGAGSVSRDGCGLVSVDEDSTTSMILSKCCCPQYLDQFSQYNGIRTQANLGRSGCRRLQRDAKFEVSPGSVLWLSQRSWAERRI